MRRSLLSLCTCFAFLVAGCAEGDSDSGTGTTSEESGTDATTAASISPAETRPGDGSASDVAASRTDQSSEGTPASGVESGSTAGTEGTRANSTTTNSTGEEVNSSSTTVVETGTDAAEASGSDSGPNSSSEITSGTDAGQVSETESDSSSRLTARPVGSTDATLGYWEYLPPNYGDEPLPLLIFTHGAGWMGDGSLDTLNTTLNDKDWPLVNLMRDDRWPNSRPFIVLAPQNPHSGCFQADDIDDFYHYAVGNYNVDAKRIYHTGQSCGAVGALEYLGEHLDEFVTAAVVVSAAASGVGFSTAGCDLGKVAIWALHNENDQTTGGADPSVDLINNLQACSPTPDAKLTVYPDATEHDAWTKTYDLSAGNDVFSWLLQHVHP